MKNGEKLQNALSNVDAELLREAFDVDDAQKMKKLAKKPFYRTGIFRSAVAAAACLALAVGIWRGMTPNTPTQTSVGYTHAPYWLTDTDVTVDTLDDLNYYAAASVLRSADTRTAASGKRTLARLDATDMTGSGVDVPPNSADDTPSAGISEDIIYYELDPDGVYTFTEVSYLQIRLTDEDGFLASKIGVGDVDVVITSVSLFGNPDEAIITFRNGDRFYSCCENSAGVRKNGTSYRHFSTHKYIQGSYLVKNLEQDNYAFEIDYDVGGNAVSISCAPYKTGGDSPDDEIQVLYSIARIDISVTLTVEQLESEFANIDLPKNDDDIALPPTAEEQALAAVYRGDDGYLFDLRENGIFVFYDARLSQESYRTGLFSLTQSGLLMLTFYVDGQAVEEVHCHTTQHGFLYRDVEYVRFDEAE